MFLERRRTHGGPALSFFLECSWIWIEVILMIFLCRLKTTYMEGFVLSHKVLVGSLSSGFAWFQMATLCRTSRADGQIYVRMCLDNHAAVSRAKVTKLLSKSLTNLDPPSAWQNLRCDWPLWVILDSAIPAIHKHFLASRALSQRWSWKQFHWVSRFEFCCFFESKSYMYVFNASGLQFHLFSSILITCP